MNLDAVHRICFLGIGGIGMSALAMYLRQMGKEVYGYDRSPSAVTDDLNRQGIPTRFIIHETLEGTPDLVVYTPAVGEDNPELTDARNRGIPVMKRAALLGLISRKYKTIAIAGTHGKTTTTSMVTHLLRSAGIDCTAFIGGISKNLGSNFVLGNDPWLVVEADEYDRSFLHLHPDIAIITSADPDHLDIYGTPQAVEEAYADFARNLKTGGKLLLHSELKAFAKRNYLSPAGYYGQEGDVFRSTVVQQNGLHKSIRFIIENQVLQANFQLPGKYNIENMTGAAAACICAGIPSELLGTGIATFSGTRRRFDVLFEGNGVVFIDDYAHHPEEVRNFLQAVRQELSGYHIVAFFQPHLFTRTRDFAQEFATALEFADMVWLVELYPARENPIPGIDETSIGRRMKRGYAGAIKKSEICRVLRQITQRPLAILTIGAGDIDLSLKEIKAEVSSWQ